MVTVRFWCLQGCAIHDPNVGLSFICVRDKIAAIFLVFAGERRAVLKIVCQVLETAELSAAFQPATRS